MRDFKDMMDAMSIKDSRKEIDSQYDSISGHADVMKSAVLYVHMLRRTLNALNGIDPNQFLLKLKEELEREVKQADEWRTNHAMLSEHLEANQQLMDAFTDKALEVATLTNDIQSALAQLDRTIAGWSVEKSKKTIAEIQQELDHT